MAQSIICQLSLRKIDFDSSLGDMSFVVGKSDIETNFSRTYASLVFMFLDLTHLNTQTTGRTSLNEWSARRSGRYLHNTQQTQETNIMSSVGFEP
jgi:hypothetical protein